MSSPTVVLIHGAFTDASSWRGLHAALAGDGIELRAPANPLRGVTAGDAAFTQAVLASIDGPVVLVAHSYGGAVITAAGNSDNVVGLVYVAGFAPDQGEDLGGLFARFPEPVANKYMRPSPGPDGETELSLDPSGFHQSFCADLPADQAGFMAVAQRSLSAVALGEKCGKPAWRSKPCWAVLPSADSAIHPDMHRFSYDRMGAKVNVVEGASHAVMLSQPAAVAETVRQAVLGQT